MAIVTRAHLAVAVREEAGMTRRAARTLFGSLFEEMAACLVAGEKVKIYGFGSFGLRGKAERPGRNPRTLEAAPIAARRVVTFRASHVLKARIHKEMSNRADGS